MEIEKRAAEWWIVGVPDCEPCGPYETKAEAEDDRLGMKRFIRYQDKPGFLTGDSNALGE